ncbi:MAG: short-chain dehydrogenase [Alphaproteobacteria bacterium]|nr:MAG: short-chain dehydrogenase [Alphaproteobacteria bacterium]
MILVTGAAGALGSAICAAVRQHGGTPFRTDIAQGPDVDARHDVTSEAGWAGVCATIERRHGRLDGLVNNAGIIRVGSVEATALADFRLVMAVNVEGVFLGCKVAWPLLRESDGAAIVNVSSTAGLVGSADHAAYNASKGAVRLLSKSVALHGARLDPPIRCNSLHPSLMPGNMAETIVAGAEDPQAAIEAIVAARNPLRRLARTEEVAAAAVFLLSPMSSYMTGSELVCDGGATAL